MSQKKNNTSQQDAAPSDKLNELLDTGTTTIEAASREDVYKLSADLVAEIPANTQWERSCVMHSRGRFSQTYKLIKN